MTLPQFEGGLLGGTLFEEEPLEGPLLVEASWASLALLVEQIWEAWESCSRDQSLEMDLRWSGERETRQQAWWDPSLEVLESREGCRQNLRLTPRSQFSCGQKLGSKVDFITEKLSNYIKEKLSSKTYLKQRWTQ